MQSGDLVSGVREWTRRVMVAGVERSVASISWDAELSGDLPDAVAGVSGVSARTGTIVWAAQSLVSTAPLTPWRRKHGWPPAPGDTVEVYVSDGVSEWRVFTGRIDSTAGDLLALSSRIVDATDQLDRNVTLEPVGQVMPGAYDEAADTWFDPVRTFVQPWHAAYRTLRACGFGLAAPTQVGGSVILDADFQGSIWPTIGTIRNPTVGWNNELAWGDGFTYVSPGSVTYTPRQVVVEAGQSLRVWGRFAAVPSTQPATNIWAYTGGRFIRTQASLDAAMTTLTVTVEYYAGDPNGGAPMLGSGTATVPAVIAEGSVWWEVLIPAGGTIAHLATAQTGATVGTPNSVVEQTIPFGTTPAPVGEAVMLSGHGLAPMIAARMGVLSLAQWRAMSSQTGPSRVRAWGAGLATGQYASRTQVARNARDLLTEIGAATLTAMWIDEHGVMQWAPANLLYTGGIARTVTTRDDIFSLDWVESIQATRHRVHVDYLLGASTVSSRHTTTLYQPSGKSQLAPNESREDFIGPPAEEEWINVDTTLGQIGASSNVDLFNYGRGSWYGGIYQYGANNETYGWTVGGLSASIEQITPETFKLTQSNTSAADTQLATAPDGGGLLIYSHLRSVPLPIIRGRGRIAFTDATVTGAFTGPGWAPDLTHDLGAWGRIADAQKVADWISERLATPIVTITGMEIEYDPRIQLGDLLRVDSRTYAGMQVDVLVIGKHESHDRGEASLSLDVRVVRTISTHVTYEDFEATHAGMDYAALEAVWGTAAYWELESSPNREA